MSTKIGAKTKGWIRNNETGEKKSFQFNPTYLSYSRDASYSEISAPGMSYPDVQFVKGNSRSFPVTLFFYDNPNTGVIKNYIKFLEGFLTPEYNEVGYTKPPEMTFCFGYFIRKCVLESLDVSIELLNDEGEPVQATITISLRQVEV